MSGKLSKIEMKAGMGTLSPASPSTGYSDVRDSRYAKTDAFRPGNH